MPSESKFSPLFAAVTEPSTSLVSPPFPYLEKACNFRYGSTLLSRIVSSRRLLRLQLLGERKTERRVS